MAAFDCGTQRSRTVERTLAQLRRRLARRYPLRDVDVAVGGQVYRILQPADPDALLDTLRGDPDERLPYWAELWPSGIVLAEALLAAGDRLAGKRAIELGCGLGVTAVAALRAGISLLATDYSTDALAFTRWNTLRNAGRLDAQPLHHSTAAVRAVARVPEMQPLNWRAPQETGGLPRGTGHFELVLAADVLYEERDVAPLVDVVSRVAGRGGELWLADPGRPHAARFLALLARGGWQVRQARTVHYEGLEQRAAVELWLLANWVS